MKVNWVVGNLRDASSTHESPGVIMMLVGGLTGEYKISKDKDISEMVEGDQQPC